MASRDEDRLRIKPGHLNARMDRKVASARSALSHKS